MGIISASALFLPIIIIFTLRLAWYKSFPALLVYYIIASSQNFLALNFINANTAFVHNYGVLNNLLDAPLMLTFMTYFSRTASFRKKLKLIIAFFVLFEITVTAINGFNIQSAIIAMAPGLLIVLGLSLVFFLHQAKITITHQKAAGKAFIAASLLFAYVGYSFVYIVYYLLKTPYKLDTFVIYYLISIVSSLLISAGIIFERKRVKQLTELQTARKELKIIYGRSQTNNVASGKQPRLENL
jgi:hypothetical protein